MDITGIQVALFFEDIIRRPERRIKPLVCNVLGVDYTEKDIRIPENINAPMDFPLVDMTYKKEFLWNIRIAQSRLDIFADLPVQFEKDVQSEIIKDFKETSNAVIEQVLSQVYINRIGIVGNFFEINEHATLEISKKMFNSKYNNSKEINFRVNNQNKFEGFHINNIIQIGEAFKTTLDSKTEEKAKYRGVLLVRDINNVPEEDKIVEKETAQKLLNMACSEFERAEIEKVWG